MSYIGNTNTTQGFTPAVDYFSGNGSTVAFTLSRPVASVAQVQANISNVPQNPSSAFSVSGNTITFTSAPPSGTNNIYVYYSSPITQVIAPGQGTVTSSSFGTITDFTTTGNTVLGDASTDTLNVGNGGLVKNASGNVGIGTSSPSSRLDVRTSAAEIGRFSSSATNGGYQVFFPDNVATPVYVGSQKAILSTGNATDFAIVGTGANNMVFGTNAAERMRIDSSGNVGIGINNPSLRLDLSGATLSNSNVTTPTTFALRANLQYCFAADSTPIGNLNNARSLGVRNYYNSTSTNYPSSYGTVTAFQHYAGSEIGVGSAYITQMAVGHSTTPVVYYRNSDVTTGATFSNWYSVNLTSVSDVRAKKDIVDATSQLGVLTQLEVKQFSFINENDAGTQIGMIAQQVDSVDPYYVTKDLDNPDMMWRVHYDKMIPMLVKSIQEQQAIIQTLTDRITALEGAK